MMKKMVGEDDIITSKSKMELSRLPLCADSHAQHVDRINHRVALLKWSRKPFYLIPKPYNGQEWIIQGGLLEPMWFRGPILPPSLIDVLNIYDEEKSDDEEITYNDHLMEYLDDDDN